MRKKQARVVVSFHTTSDAIAMQQASIATRLRGRLIPIPRQLSAGCGLAWSEPAENAPALRQVIIDQSLEHEQIHELDL